MAAPNLICYRLVRAKYADSLYASGVANRWNRDNEFVLYASTSRSLASLELLVHRSNIRPNFVYKMMVLEINLPSMELLDKLSPGELPGHWRGISAYPDLQQLGSTWYTQESSLVLEVPSVLIPQESNFVIHARHIDFSRLVQLQGAESFFWDERLFYTSP